MNSFGRIFKVAIFGESHGESVGINIEGVCGTTEEGQGVIHVLVADADAARVALSEAGFDVGSERDVKALCAGGSADRAQVPAGIDGQAAAIAQVDQVAGVAQPLVDDRRQQLLGHVPGSLAFGLVACTIKYPR